MWRLIPLLLTFALASCGGVVAKSEIRGKPPQASRSGPVCLFAGSLPTQFTFIELGLVKATKRSYGAVEELDIAIANEARRIGADAVINLQAGQRFKGPLPWRVTSPTGVGTAIKLTPESPKIDCAELRGKSS